MIADSHTNTHDTRSRSLGALPQWRLDDLYSGMKGKDLKRDLAKAEQDVLAFAKNYQGRILDLVKNAAHEVADALQKYEAMQDALGRLMSYASLLYAGDTTDTDRAKFYGDMQAKLTDIARHILFFPLELNKLSDDDFATFLEVDALTRFRPWLENLRKEKPYQLEDRVEQLFLEKSVTSAGAWNRLFDETLAALRFEVEGEILPLEPTLNRLVDKDQAKRKKAADALAKTFRDHLHIFTFITNTLAKDKDISNRWRGFEDVADSRHLANRVERPVVEALVSAVEAAYPKLSHRYYALKAKWFGVDTLPHWDRNAPLPESQADLVTWQQAREIVLNAYGGFSPKIADIAKPFFDKSWIDAPARAGKSPGAFAHPTVPSAHPYILLNYQGKTRDVMTLAHELGHGVHQILAAAQGPLMAPTPLTLAETASVFGEMLTFQALLGSCQDARERKILLAGKVEDMLNTVVRQIAFYGFERKVHLARRSGELTADQLCALWMEVQAESLGPSIRLEQGYETFWAYIPHFIHAPFYVYAYAFGDCLVNSLYAIYQSGHADFEQHYFDMLRAGGTKHHKELLMPFGLNASDPAFWQKGLRMIERLIDELEGL